MRSSSRAAVSPANPAPTIATSARRVRLRFGSAIARGRPAAREPAAVAAPVPSRRRREIACLGSVSSVTPRILRKQAMPCALYAGPGLGRLRMSLVVIAGDRHDSRVCRHCLRSGADRPTGGLAAAASDHARRRGSRPSRPPAGRRSGARRRHRSRPRPSRPRLAAACQPASGRLGLRGPTERLRLPGRLHGRSPTTIQATPPVVPGTARRSPAFWARRGTTASAVPASRQTRSSSRSARATTTTSASSTCRRTAINRAIDEFGARVVSMSWLAGDELETGLRQRDQVASEHAVRDDPVRQRRRHRRGARRGRSHALLAELGRTSSASPRAVPTDGLNCGDFGKTLVDIAVPTENSVTTAERWRLQRHGLRDELRRTGRRRDRDHPLRDRAGGDGQRRCARRSSTGPARPPRGAGSRSRAGSGTWSARSTHCSRRWGFSRARRRERLRPSTRLHPRR